MSDDPGWSKGGIFSDPDGPAERSLSERRNLDTEEEEGEKLLLKLLKKKKSFINTQDIALSSLLCITGHVLAPHLAHLPIKRPTFHDVREYGSYYIFSLTTVRHLIYI